MRYLNKTFVVLLLNLLAVALGIMIKKSTKMDPFTEGGFITLLSALQMLVIAWLSYSIFKQLNMQRFALNDLKKPHALWAIISFGFVFLAADELFKIHENIDYTIHFIFNIQESGLTDRIDDMVIGLYGIIGIFVLYYYRKEIMEYSKNFIFIYIGFVLMFFMVISDSLSNRNDILPYFFEKQFSYTVQHWLSIVEDCLKLLAVAFFLIAFYSIYTTVKRSCCKTQDNRNAKDLS